MTISDVAPRNCPQCAGGESRVLARYSRQPWFVVQCSTCGFVYLRNPPTYEQLVSEFAWEKTRAIEKQRRKRQSPLLQALDERTRWRTGLLGGSLALLFRQIFPLGRVLDVGCGSGRRVPEPFIPFGIEISRALFEQADAHMRGRGGWAVHAPALKGIGQFQTGYFSGIVLRSFLEHEVAPKAVLQESARVLADEGSIFVRVPNFGSVNRRVIGGGWCGIRHPDHVNYFTLRSLQKMAADCGLQVRVLNPLLLWSNDNINAVLKKAVPPG